uniref:Head fiber protein n=1 Tax=Siphoviridae sp. ctdd214 TaxID=2825581 RepID=A0A8S5V5Z5_9CAUD|nr:MAG TPA: Head fiber protein [Siphoviridae sp. ctdd214]
MEFEFDLSGIPPKQRELFEKIMNDKSTVKQGVHVPDATGEAPTKEEFNALLTSLRNAGIIASS